MHYKVDEKNQVLRAKERGHYDKKTAYKILDSGKICHVGITVDDQPFVIPMAYARKDDSIYLHGALNSRLCKTLASGVKACVTVTHLDGLVLARSTFHHSINYRSVVAFGTAIEIQNEEEKNLALDAIVEFLTPGRTIDSRAANRKELNATSVIKFEIEQASSKIRTGDPKDIESDLDRDVWAGVVPISMTTGEWIDSHDLKDGITLPDYKDHIDNSI